MEFLSISLLFFLAFCYIFYKLNSWKNGRGEKFQPPPGRKGWLSFGETIEYISIAKKGFPEKFFEERIKTYSSKVFETCLIFRPMTMFCSAEGNKFLFSNENRFVQSWWPSTLSKVFPFSNNKLSGSEINVRLRKLVSLVFRPDAVKTYVNPMNEAIKHHLNTHWNFEQVKVHCLAQKCAFSISCQLFLNVEDAEIIDRLEKPMKLILSGMVSLPLDLPGMKYSRTIKASEEIRKVIKGMVKQRKIELLEKKDVPTHDIMSQMVMESYADGDFLNETDIANYLFAMLVGSYDTISIAIVSTMKFLTELPQVYEEVLKEQMEIENSKGKEEVLLKWEDTRKMKYLRNVISEAMRLKPPSSGTYREAITDFTYQGFLIRKGKKIHWNVYATHKNPEYFPNPEKFDPTRFDDAQVPFSYVPFGGGPRMCPGAEYARLLVLLFIHNVVKQFRWDMVFPDENMILDPLLRPVHGLPIRLYQRTS